MPKVVLSDAQACAVRYHLLMRYDAMALEEKPGFMPHADFCRLRDVLFKKFSVSVSRLNAPLEDGKHI